MCLNEALQEPDNNLLVLLRCGEAGRHQTCRAALLLDRAGQTRANEAMLGIKCLCVCDYLFSIVHPIGPTQGGT